MQPLIILSAPLAEPASASLPQPATLLLRSAACQMLPMWQSITWLQQWPADQIFVLSDDARAHGIYSLPEQIKLISFEQMVELTLNHSPVISW